MTFQTAMNFSWKKHYFLRTVVLKFFSREKLWQERVKKLKYRKANEDEYKFNLKLGETLSNAESAAQKSQLEKVKSELEEGEKLLLER